MTWTISEIIKTQKDTQKVNDRDSTVSVSFILQANMSMLHNHIFLLFHNTSCYVTTKKHPLLDVIMLHSHCHIKCHVA